MGLPLMFLGSQRAPDAYMLVAGRKYAFHSALSYDEEEGEDQLADSCYSVADNMDGSHSYWALGCYRNLHHG